jgi:hypothetical protein
MTSMPTITGHELKHAVELLLGEDSADDQAVRPLND